MKIIATKKITVPKIVQLPSGAYRCQLRIHGDSVSITDYDYNTVYGQAVAYKTGLMKVRSKPDDITLRQAFTKYFDLRRNRLSPTTLERYEKIRDNSFQTIMDMKLSEINKKTLEDAVAAEEGRKGRTNGKQAASSIINSYHLLSTVLHRYAPDIDTSVSLPEKKRKVPQLPEPEEVIRAVKGTDVELPCLLSMWLSLSMSEILGLTKSESIHGDQLTIVKTAVMVGKELVDKEYGKEEERTRSMKIPPYIMHLIDEVETDRLVELTGRQIYYRFQKALKNAGVPLMRFHDLRHMNASVSAMLKIQDAVIQERGGWKTDYVMKRVYTHTFSSERQQADEIINSYFDGILEGNP